MSGQLSMWDPLPAPKARRRGPITSQNAAARATAFDASHAGRILAALRAFGPATAKELAARRMLLLTVVQIDRRLPELQKRGLAAPGEIRDGFRVWRAT